MSFELYDLDTLEREKEGGGRYIVECVCKCDREGQ